MSGPPVQQYVPPSPYAQVQPPEGKKGTFPILIVAIILVIVIMLGMIGMWMFVSTIDGINGEPWEDTLSFQDEILIDEGGHFRYLTDAWSDEFQVNITIGSLEGGPFDVYIMTVNQYENAYGNGSTGAFSATAEWQNTSSVLDVYLDEGPSPASYYIVVDNVEMAYVPGNAVPEGPIKVDIELDMIWRYDGW